MGGCTGSRRGLVPEQRRHGKLDILLLCSRMKDFEIKTLLVVYIRLDPSRATIVSNIYRDLKNQKCG